MSIKDDHHYKYNRHFATYLRSALEQGSISKGQYELMRISETLFLEYCFRYNNQPNFKQSQDQLYKSSNRDSKIQDIFDESNT